ELANTRALVIGASGASVVNLISGSSQVLTNTELARAGATATELPTDTRRILVAGGVDSANELVGPGALFNPARLDTDKDDYAPDEDVVVNGRGWKPGEEVDLYVVDDLGWIYDSTVTADADGKFSADPYFVVEMRHLGVTFDLVATGADSGLEASVRFTDKAMFSIDDVTVTEGNSGTVNAVFHVTLDTAVPTGATWTVDY